MKKIKGANFYCDWKEIYKKFQNKHTRIYIGREEYKSTLLICIVYRGYEKLGKKNHHRLFTVRLRNGDVCYWDDNLWQYDKIVKFLLKDKIARRWFLREVSKYLKFNEKPIQYYFKSGTIILDEEKIKQQF